MRVYNKIKKWDSHFWAVAGHVFDFAESESFGPLVITEMLSKAGWVMRVEKHLNIRQ